MAKKELVRIEEGARTVTAAFACAELLDAGLEKQLGPATAEEAALPNGGGLALRAGRRLAHLRHSFETAREVLARVRDDNRRWRRRRDRAFAEVYDLVKTARRFCRAFYGKARADEFLGLRGALPREAGELHQKAGPVHGRLADAEWPMPTQEVDLKGINVDRHKLAASLKQRAEELGTALDALDAGETREAIALAVKERAKVAFKTFQAKSARFLEAGLELAGLDDLVATVRPGVGRRGRPAKGQLEGAAAGLPAGADPALPAAAMKALAAAEPAARAEAEDGEDVAAEPGEETPESAADAG
jgi:hypothetical protein